MNIGITPSVNFTKKKRAAKTEVSVYSRIIKLTNNQARSQKKKRAITLKNGESDDKGAVAFVKTPPQFGCASQDSEPSASLKGVESGDTRSEKFWDQLDEYNSQSAPVKRWSKKINDHRLKKKQVKIPHQRSPYAVKFEDRSQEEAERQERCARGKAWNVAKNTYKLKEEDKATIPCAYK